MHPLKDNPFFVLELPPTATPVQIERQGKKLLGMLDLNLHHSLVFNTPYGPQLRTAERIREAVQLLLDPCRRLPFEVWATTLTGFDPAVDAPASTALPLSQAEFNDEPPGPSFDAADLVWWKP